MIKNRKVIKDTVSAMMKSHGIQDYKFESGRKEGRLSFKVDGKWESVRYATSPRSPSNQNFIRQSINRIIARRGQ